MPEAAQVNKKSFTWSIFLKWVLIFYAGSLCGVFLKIYLQEGGRLAFSNYAQVIAASLIPFVFMALASPVFLIGMALKRFKIQNAKGVLIFTAIIYIVILLNRLLSTQPL